MLNFIKFIHFCGLIGLLKGLFYYYFVDFNMLYNYKYAYSFAGYIISFIFLVIYCFAYCRTHLIFKKKYFVQCKYAVVLNALFLLIYAYKGANTLIFFVVWLTSFYYYSNKYLSENWKSNCGVIINACLIIADYLLLYTTNLFQKISKYKIILAVATLLVLCLVFFALTFNLNQTVVFSGQQSSRDSSVSEFLGKDLDHKLLDIEASGVFCVKDIVNPIPIMQTARANAEGITVFFADDRDLEKNIENKYSIYIKGSGGSARAITANLDKECSYKYRATITNSRMFEFYLNDLKLYESYFIGSSPKVDLSETIISLGKNKSVNNWQVTYSAVPLDLKAKLSAVLNETSFSLIIIALTALFVVAASGYIWDEGRRCWKVGFPILVFVLIFVYNIIFANSFFPVAKDWFQNYAWLMHTGSFPYRDFYLILPPGFILLTYFLQIFFGNSIWWFNIFGILMFSSAAVLQYYIYKYFFSDKIAFFCAIVSMIFYESEITLNHYDFVHPCIFLGYFALLLALSGQRKSSGWLIEFIVGMLCAMSFMFKQSVGLFIVLLFSMIYVCFALRQNYVKKVVAYFVGVLLILAGVVLWLYSNDAFYPFIQQCFVGAGGAKGGIVAMLTGWLDHNKPNGVLIGILATAGILGRIHSFEEYDEKSLLAGVGASSLYQQLIISLAFLTIIITPCLGGELFFEITDKYSTFLQSLMISSTCDVTLIGVIALTYYAYYYLRYAKKRLEFCVVGFIVTCAFGMGLSAAVNPYGAAIGLGYIIGMFLMKPNLASGEYVMDKVKLVRKKRIAARFHKTLTIIMIVAFSCATMFYVSEKYHRPYAWWGYVERPIWESVPNNSIPQLAGISLNQHNSLAFSDLVSYVKNNSSSIDLVYSYPSLPLFNVLASRKNPCFSQVDWFDFSPDDEAQKSLDTIKKHPPKFIIYLDCPEFVYKGHEDLFRQGKHSKQRNIKEYIEQSINNGKMIIIKKYLVSSGYTLYLLEPIIQEQKAANSCDGENTGVA